MPDAVLTQPDVYRTFTPPEVERLTSFIDDARQLGHMQLFKETPETASLSFSEEDGMTTSMAEPKDESVRAAITLFRQVYDHDEPHSFRNTVKLLKQSVHEHDGPQRDDALAELDTFFDAEKRALGGIGVALVIESPNGTKPIDARKLLDVYFHGKYLHAGNAKAKLAAALEDMQPFSGMTLFAVMMNLRNLYWVTANATEAALAVQATA